MKKLKIFAVLAASMIFVCGSFQVCLADSFDVDIEKSDNNVKLVFTVDGKKYELKLNPYTEKATVDEISTTAGSDNAAADSGNITIDKAKEIALADAGLSDAVFTKAKTDYDDGILVYELKFTDNNTKYEYEINAATGSIVSRDIDYKNDSTIKVSDRSNHSGKTGSNTQDTSQYNITSDEAKNIALADAGISASSVKYIHSYIDKDDGVFLYEVEFVVDNTEYDYEINADTGAIISKDVENH